MAARILGKAEGDGEGKHPAWPRLPECHCQRARGGEEKRHAAGKGGHDERQQPAVPPRLDQESFGDPIETGEKEAETEPEPHASCASQPVRQALVAHAATVEQPDERSESEEKHRPDVKRRERKNRQTAEHYGEERAAKADKPGNPIRCFLDRSKRAGAGGCPGPPVGSAHAWLSARVASVGGGT